MKKIIFANQVNSLNFGRGRDKKKRKKRNTLLTIAAGSVAGSLANTRRAENAYTGQMYQTFTPNQNPTPTNIKAVGKNLRKYKIGQGSQKADIIKKSFNKVRLGGAWRGAAAGALLGAGGLVTAKAFKDLKNRKTIKIGGKTLVYKKRE